METNVTENGTQIAQQPTANSAGTVFCKFCGSQIAADAVICTHCGRQVEQLQGAQTAQPQVVINNSNSNVNTNTNTNVVGAMGRPRNKWTAFFLCLFLGFLVRISFMRAKREWEYCTCSPAACSE